MRKLLLAPALSAVLAGFSYKGRRALLESLRLSGPCWTTTPVYDDADALLDGYADLGLEAVVAKRTDSIYRPGERSRYWIKWKTPEWRRVHVTRRSR